jgi:hypothetical protein
MNRLIKIVILIAVVIVAKRWVWPWLQQEFAGSRASSVQTSGDSSCSRAAASASEVWGKGLGRFVNPPYDLGEWNRFRNDVDAQIAAAEQVCIACTGPSCEDVRGALRDLRGLANDLDRAIRSGGSPPGDIVQRQESIDNRISGAR